MMEWKVIFPIRGTLGGKSGDEDSVLEHVWRKYIEWMTNMGFAVRLSWV